MAEAIDTAQFRLGDIFITRHNAKIASIRNGNTNLIIQPGEFLKVPFTPMNFDEGSGTKRFNLFVHPCRSLLEDLATIDEWLIAYLAEHSIKYFKKLMQPEEVRGTYVSRVRHSDKGYPPTVKFKIDL